MATETQMDHVYTYSINTLGEVTGESEDLRKALQKGCRIVHYTATPAGSAVFVTVVLTDGSRYGDMGGSALKMP